MKNLPEPHLLGTFGFDRHYPIMTTQLTRIPATNDQRRFYDFDPIAMAEDCGSLPTQGFRAASNSVNDCRLTATSKPKVRVPNRPGVTGGYVEDADRGMATNGGNADHKAAIANRRNVKAGKRAAKRAMEDRKRERVIAELRARGYAV